MTETRRRPDGPWRGWGGSTVVHKTTAAAEASQAWPAEQAEEALRRIVTVMLHSAGPMGLREMAVLCLACDALGIDEPIMVSDPTDPPRLAVVPDPRSVLAG
jgi:hypothetical protein